MRTVAVRLRRGQDLRQSIEKIARERQLQGAVILSAVGCVSRLRLRDASGVHIQTLPEDFEIVSLMGTVSALRCHIHGSFSREDLSTVGGHVAEGCIVNTTCELVLLELGQWQYGVEEDPETGYDEIVFQPCGEHTCREEKAVGEGENP